MYRIRTYNSISCKGLDHFSTEKYQISSQFEAPHAYILRSHKLHKEVVPDSVIAIARAGAGFNNIPVTDYTNRGIVVFNTPGANANAVKELVIASLLLGSRDIYGGMNYVQSLGHLENSEAMNRTAGTKQEAFCGP